MAHAYNFNTPEAGANESQINVILSSGGSPRASLGYRQCQKNNQAKGYHKQILKIVHELYFLLRKK